MERNLGRSVFGAVIMTERELVLVRTLTAMEPPGSMRAALEDLLVELDTHGQKMVLESASGYTPSFPEDESHLYLEATCSPKTSADSSGPRKESPGLMAGLGDARQVTLVARLGTESSGVRVLLEAGFRVAGTIKEGRVLTEHAMEPHFPVSGFVKGPLAPVVVLGRANVNLLAQVRALGRCGIPVFCILTRGEPPIIAKLSRYVSAVYDARGFDDDSIVHLINKVYSEAGSKPVLFPGGDLDVSLIARIWPSVHEFARVVSDPARCSEFNDKNLQIETVGKAGIRVPASHTVNNLDDLEQALSTLAFPVISKPLELSRKGGFRGKILITGSADNLRRHLVPVLERGQASLLLQEYIPGDIENLLFALVTCDQLGDVMMSVTGRKLQDNTKGGMGVGETLRDPQLDLLVQKTFRAFGISGVLGVEFKKHEVTGEYFYIESNFRPENIHSVAEAAGVNLQLGAYLACLGETTLYTPLPQRAATWSDYSLVALGNIKRRFKATGGDGPGTAVSRQGVKTDALWTIDDCFPALAWYLLKFTSLFRRESGNLLRRLRR